MKLTDRVIGFISTYAPRPRRIFRRRPSTRHQSPMNTLPDELLLHILHLAANDHVNHPIATSILSHVCSRWRMVALSNGILWGRIVLTFPVYPRHLAFVVACLERSGTYPLDIFLDFRDPAWNWDEDAHSFRWQEMEPIMRLFLVHVMRWRQFDLLADTWSPIFTFLWYTRHVKAAPALETLALSRCNLYLAAEGHIFHPVALRQPLSFFGGSFLPSLRSVSLIGVHVDWEQPSLRNLSELQLKFHAHDVMPTLSQFEAIFHSSPRLSHLAIFGWGPILDNSRTIPNARHLHLQHLQRLSFGFLDIPYSLQLLSLFDFPSLSELVLEDVSRVVNPSDLQDGSSLIQWLSSTPSSLSSAIRPPSRLPLHQLRKLEIHNVRCSEPTFASFLRRLISLKGLGLFDVANGLLSLLIPQNDLGFLCSQLDELHCQDMDGEAVLTVVASRSRAGPVSPMRKVVVEFVRQVSPSPGSPLYTRLVEAGIEVQGRYGSESSGSQSS